MRNLSIIQNPFQRRFYPAAADQMRLPVALLTGFLGAGKTTLLNALLAHPAMADTAVAINEFGAVALDQHLIARDEGDVLVLANGCLCCNLAGDMEQAVMRLFTRRAEGEVPAFARLLIEPSGLSDPTPIMQALLRNPVMSRAFRLEAIVTVVDSVLAPAQLRDHAETRKQVALADMLVLTKPDMTDSAAMAALHDALQQYNPVAPQHLAEHGAVDAELLFPPSFFSADAPATAPTRSAFSAELIDESQHLSGVLAVSLTTVAPLSWRRFDDWLRGIRLQYAAHILRLKGLLAVEGEAGPVVVQGVHHVLHAPVALPAWPEGERVTRLLFILQDMPAEALRTRWHDFLKAEAVQKVPA